MGTLCETFAKTGVFRLFFSNIAVPSKQEWTTTEK